jgi:RimJ/RimL family protein N-acetyltransferase
MVEIRVLDAEDAENLHALRIRSLTEHPEAFGMSVEEEQNTPLETIQQQLSIPESPTFGAFADGNLVGIASLYRHPRTKTRHRAMLSGMYVVPEARGQSIGEALMNAALEFAWSSAGIEDVILAVTVGNEAARQLYIKAGFTPYSIDPRYIRVDKQYFDIEWMILRLQHG